MPESGGADVVFLVTRFCPSSVFRFWSRRRRVLHEHYIIDDPGCYICVSTNSSVFSQASRIPKYEITEPTTTYIHTYNH